MYFHFEDGITGVLCCGTYVLMVRWCCFILCCDLSEFVFIDCSAISCE